MPITAKLIALSALISCAAISSPVAAQIAPGFNSTTLPANDDGSSGLVTLPFMIDFYGTTYNSLYVNNNGNLTFASAQSSYTPTGLGSNYSGQAIIAPFFADVDTRGAGSGLTSYGVGTYNGKAAFGATWNGVGYFGTHSDKLDTFQALLVDRSDIGLNDFDIIFNYGNIQWETGDASGGSQGRGGTSAAVGFNAGTGNASGTYFQAPGSLQNGALVDGGSNALNGQTFDFQVRAGVPVQVPVTPAVPEPATWGMMILGMGAVGFALRSAKRHSDKKFDAKIKRMTEGALA